MLKNLNLKSVNEEKMETSSSQSSYILNKTFLCMLKVQLDNIIKINLQNYKKIIKHPFIENMYDNLPIDTRCKMFVERFYTI